jgi:hypothetical protein
MPEYPVRPSHPYGSDPAKENPVRAPYGRGQNARNQGEYGSRADDYGTSSDGERGWDRPSRADWSGPDERAGWTDSDQRDDRSAYGRPDRRDRQASEEFPQPPARPLSRRARREAERGFPEADPTAWIEDDPEPRWNGRSRLRSASSVSDVSGEEVARSRYRNLGPLTTGMMKLIRGNRRIEPSDETNPHGIPRDEEEELKTQRRRSSFFDMESEAPEPGRTSGYQESGPGNGASFPSLGGSRTGPPPRAPQSFRRPKPRRRRAPLIAAVLAVLLVIGGVVYALGSHGSQGSGTAADPSATPSVASSTPKASATKAAVTTGAAKKVKLGVFKGGSSPSQISQFSTWLGRDVDYAVDYSTRSTWDEIANPTYMLNNWQGSDYRMVYAVAMLPTAISSKATLAAGADGDYDQYYKTLARNLVAYGQGDSIIRLGWEFNVSGWPWHPGSSDTEDFIGYWRHIVKAMRSVPGTDKLQFDWNVNNGGESYDSTVFYPGKKYVDYIGVDVYDTSWDENAYPYPGSCNAECKLGHQQQAWDDVIGATFGLSFWSSFAKSEGKKLSLPEWGLWDRPDGHGGGDDTYFVQQMYKFIDDPANNVGYQAYFDYNTDSKGNHKLETLSKAGAKYQKLFGK